MRVQRRPTKPKASGDGREATWPGQGLMRRILGVWALQENEAHHGPPGRV